MEFKQIIARALSVRKQYAALEEEKHGRAWTDEELMLGFVNDVGTLAKLIQAKEGVRDIEALDQKLGHELSDCLWSIIVLSSKYGVNLEASFLQTMDEIQRRIEAKTERNDSNA